MPVSGAATTVAMMLTASLGLAACSFACPPTGLEQAASYGGTIAPIGAEVYTKSRNLPNDRWVRNPDVEDFLRATLREEGFAALQSKYGMQCIPRDEPSGCTDCHFCTRTFPGKVLAIGVWDSCENSGQISVRAAIGPGQAVSAMTYRHWPEMKVKRQ